MDIQKDSKQTPKEQLPTLPSKEEPQVHTLLLQLRDALTMLDKAISNKETRTVAKITKNVRKYRKVIKPHHVKALYEGLGMDDKSELFSKCKHYNSQFTQKVQINKNLTTRISKTLEMQVFVKILAVIIWWKEGAYDECLNQTSELITKIQAANRRSLDNYGAFLYYYYSRIHQKKSQDEGVREHLLEALNKSCVRSDQIGQSTLLNLLLRNYLRYNLLDAAYNLIEKTSFPEGKSNNQFCKYLYYTGRVKAVRRDYADAHQRLNQAIRKSPDSAKGFRIYCQKAAIVVQLLQGQIPNRQIFSDQKMFANTYPYYKLIQVVLEGSLTAFHKIVEQYKSVYQKDRLYTLIMRLNQIVIRVGLRRISLAYSRISLQDIGSKLSIPFEDVEFVVAKALRDNLMSGEIDHDSSILNIKGDHNVYVTNQPQNNLDKRIRYCLNLYHETQKAITYPQMKMNLQEFKDEEIDTAELMNLLDFDDDM